MKILVSATLALFALAGSAQSPAPIDYQFDDVRRTVTLTSGSQQSKAAKGTKALGGDKVQTGWFSYALIASAHYGAKFELYGSTDVRLSSATPGVILSLERGKLHAIFDKITGTEPRIVQTPGALLAVRGTQYDVDVDSQGQTTLRVFEGIVELQSELRPAPMMIRAGEAANYSRREPPAPRQMSQKEREQGAGRGPQGERGPGGDRGMGNDHPRPPQNPPNQNGPDSGQRPGDDRGNPPRQGGGQGGQGGGHAGPPPPPPPPPPRSGGGGPKPPGA